MYRAWRARARYAVHVLPLLLACHPEPAPAVLRIDGDAPVNLLFISIDTLRRDALGRYGGGAATPVLDDLLTRGVTLEDHRTCAPWTYAAVTCALTGSDGEPLGFVPQRDTSFETLPEDVWLLADHLGHRSSLISANPLLGPETGTARGYDEVCTGCTMETPAGVVTDLALAFDTSSEPWFLHVHYMDPHLPYEPRAGFTEEVEALPPLPYDLKTGDGMAAALADLDTMSPELRAEVIDRSRRWYDTQVSSMDAEIGRLLSALDDRGALDTTLIVVWSDHGEQIFDHLGIRHGSTLYAEETRGVASLLAPGLSAASWAGPTTHADLVPSVLTLLGRETPSHVTGAPVGSATMDPPRFATVFSTIGDATRQSVEQGGWRLIYSWDGQVELFDLTTDPTEHDDQFRPDHPAVWPLWTLLQPRVAQLAALPGAPTPTPWLDP